MMGVRLLLFICLLFALEGAASQLIDFHQRMLELKQKLHRTEGRVYPRNACQQWIVITTINDVTESVAAVAALPDWCVVIVGDKKGLSSSQYKLDGVIYLDVEAQAQLDYAIIGLLPHNSYARKNIGYLYAIEHGASVIYETDDDNQLLGDLSGFLSSRNRLLVYEGVESHSVNPYAHFGQPSIWPRGYPLSQITKPDSMHFTRQSVNSWIQQSLANGDPDVDAIFRLTRKTHEERINISFDATAPPVSLPPHLFCPYNSQNTLHHKAAFWGLLIPITVAFRVSDIWRGYWAQRLLWQVGGQLVFLPPTVYQERNAHNYLSDFNDELQMYTQTEKLIEFLLAWSPRSTSFVDQIQELSGAMRQGGFWGEDDVRLTQAWCNDLLRVGYQFPPLSPVPTAQAKPVAIYTTAPQQQTVMMKHLQIQVERRKKRAVTLFICILAAPGELGLRNLLRKTYLTFSHDLTGVDYRFFTDYKDEATHQALLQEHGRHGDLHISGTGVHCPEGQHCRNSFGLVVEALQWTLDHYEFSYFLRLDLDGYLCLPQLMQDLAQRPKRAYVAGNFGCHSQEPDRFFRADGAFILFTHDLAQAFMDLQPLLHMDRENTFAINFASFVFNLDVVYEHRLWSTNISAVCERQVFVHWLKIERRIKKAHDLALERLQQRIPITPLRNVCEKRVLKNQNKVFQISPFWGEHQIEIQRHWPKIGEA